MVTVAGRQVLVHPGGLGVDTDKHSSTLVAGTVGVLHGSMSYLLQDDDGQVIEAHSAASNMITTASTT